MVQDTGSLIKISIHALREEGDNYIEYVLLKHLISIHALREEGDSSSLSTNTAPCDFYPRPPRGGRPAREQQYQNTIGISIHALREEGDCEEASDYDECIRFLSTPSARRAT